MLLINSLRGWMPSSYRLAYSLMFDNYIHKVIKSLLRGERWTEVVGIEVVAPWYVNIEVEVEAESAVGVERDRVDAMSPIQRITGVVRAQEPPRIDQHLSQRRNSFEKKNSLFLRSSQLEVKLQYTVCSRMCCIFDIVQLNHLTKRAEQRKKMSFLRAKLRRRIWWLPWGSRVSTQQRYTLLRTIIARRQVIFGI